MWGWIKRLWEKVTNALRNWLKPPERPVERPREPLARGDEGGRDPARMLPPVQQPIATIVPNSLQAWLRLNIDDIDNFHRAEFDSIINNEFFSKSFADRAAYLLTENVKARLFFIFSASRNFDAKNFLKKCVGESLPLIARLCTSGRYAFVLSGNVIPNVQMINRLMPASRPPERPVRISHEVVAQIREIFRRIQAGRRPGEEFKLSDISATKIIEKTGIDGEEFEEFRCLLTACIIVGKVGKVREGSHVWYYDDKALRRYVEEKAENPMTRNPLPLDQIQDGTDEYREKVKKQLVTLLQKKIPGLTDEEAEKEAKPICEELLWESPGPDIRPRSR